MGRLGRGVRHPLQPEIVDTRGLKPGRRLSRQMPSSAALLKSRPDGSALILAQVGRPAQVF